MPLSVLVGSDLKPTTKCKVLDGATLRNIIRAKVLDGSTLRTVATFSTPLTLTSAPTYQYMSSYGYPQGSGLITASPTGGVGPFTYVWSVLNGGGGVSAPNAATTQVTSGTLVMGETKNVSVQCVCTDNLGQTATATASVDFLYLNPYG